MNETRVVDANRASYDVYIGTLDKEAGRLPTKWSNIYKVGEDGTHKECVDKYAFYILARPDLVLALPELRGKRLGCNCPGGYAGERCHGDVLIGMLDRYESGEFDKALSEHFARKEVGV